MPTVRSCQHGGGDRSGEGDRISKAVAGGEGAERPPTRLSSFLTDVPAPTAARDAIGTPAVADSDGPPLLLPLPGFVESNLLR